MVLYRVVKGGKTVASGLPKAQAAHFAANVGGKAGVMPAKKNPRMTPRGRQAALTFYVFDTKGALIGEPVEGVKTALGALKRAIPRAHVYSSGYTFGSVGDIYSYAIDKEPHHVFVATFPPEVWRRVFVDEKRSANPARKTMPAPIKPAKRANPARKAPVGMFKNPDGETGPGDFSHSSTKVLGRAWIEADSARIKDFGDVVQVRLTWKDGEWLQMLFDTKAGALAQIRRLGFK